jgi:RNA polymerase sigma-70 factor (ECF subfamily)
MSVVQSRSNQQFQLPVQTRTVRRHVRRGIGTRQDRNARIRYRRVNGDPSAVLVTDDSPFAVLVLDVDAGTGRTGIYSVTNPDKLVRAR